MVRVNKSTVYNASNVILISIESRAWYYADDRKKNAPLNNQEYIRKYIRITGIMCLSKWEKE